MKIVAGLGCIDDYVRLAKAGADEFFCGYVPYEWTKKYGVMLPLNRREVLYYNVQIGTLEDLKILRRLVDRYQVPVKITFNSLFYLEEQYELIAKLIRQCMEIGFDTFIIADVALLFYLREQRIPCKVHLSGEMSEVNHSMMKVMNQFQISRYIFHRKNTIEDMKSCIEQNGKQGMEYEAFVLNEWCHFTGGFCNSLHCDELVHLCKVPYQMAKLNSREGKFDELIAAMQQEKLMSQDNDSDTEDWEDSRDDYLTGATGCGLCALRRLKDAGVTHLKLVGRGNYVDYMERDIRQLKKAIKLCEQSQSSTGYVDDMKKELFGHGCSEVCYYRK